MTDDRSGAGPSPKREMGAERGRIRVGISSCLLGAAVRYDGGHKRDAYITGTLGRYFEFVPLCPEVAIGLGTPRPPIRLVRAEGDIRVRGRDDPSREVTDALRGFARSTAARLRGEISGYIFKRASPSCGMERVRVYGENGMPAGRGAGAYAGALMAAMPLLPCEEEGRLGDPGLRENFIERVFVFDCWQKLEKAGLTPARLVEFHTVHKSLVLAHNQAAYRRMGRLVARAGEPGLDRLAAEYARELMTALKRRATRGRHANVLEHLFGFVSRHLDAPDRVEMVEILADYRAGLLPRLVPVTLLKHHFRRHPSPYVERQVYLDPHPKELLLRNAH